LKAGRVQLNECRVTDAIEDNFAGLRSLRKTRRDQGGKNQKKQRAVL
jgi:hypothetical protein